MTAAYDTRVRMPRSERRHAEAVSKPRRPGRSFGLLAVGLALAIALPIAESRNASVATSHSTLASAAVVDIGTAVTTRSFSCAGSLPPESHVGSRVVFQVRLGRYAATLSGTVVSIPPSTGWLASPLLTLRASGRTTTYRILGPDPASPFGLSFARANWRAGVNYAETPLCIALLGAPDEPTVIVPNYLGGAHCCTLLNLVGAAGGGIATATDLGNPSAVLVPEGGRSIIVTADNAFAYAFTDYAASAMPIRVLQLAADSDSVSVVTRRWLDLVRQDSAYWLSLFQASIKRPPPYDERGLLAAWAADECELNLCTAALDRIRGISAKYLRFPDTGTSVASYVRQLQSFLQGHGYG